MRLLIALTLLLLASPLLAAEMQVHRNIGYAKERNRRQTLDLYAPVKARQCPVLVWIHGGGWRIGDKSGVQQKPQAFVDQKFIFVSINYRFVPTVTLETQVGDVARAIRWVHDHAADYGGTPTTIFVGGHSAGAHLAALVCTDARYLMAEGLSLASIKGCLPVDTAAYDAERQIRERGPSRSRLYVSVFGDTAESQRRYSPLSYVAKGKHIPPFLLLHVAARAESRDQTEAFAKALRQAGVEANVVPGRGKTHRTINHELGLADDAPTAAVFSFLQRQLKRN